MTADMAGTRSCLPRRERTSPAWDARGLIPPKRVPALPGVRRCKDATPACSTEKLGGGQGCGHRLPAPCLSAEGSGWPSLTRCLCLVRLGRPPSSAVSSRVSQQGWGSLTLLSGFQAVTLGCFSAFPAGSSARPGQQEGSGQRRPLEDLCMGAAPVGRLGLRSPGRGTQRRDESLRAELGNLRAGAINHTATVS